MHITYTFTSQNKLSSVYYRCIHICISHIFTHLHTRKYTQLTVKFSRKDYLEILNQTLQFPSIMLNLHGYFAMYSSVFEEDQSKKQDPHM